MQTRKFAVQWLPRRAKYPRGLVTQAGFESFEAALNFGRQNSGPATAKSAVLLAADVAGINQNKYFLDYILK